MTLPPFPEAVRYLWTAFWDIRSRCGGTGFGPLPIGWSDIDAYSRLTRIGLLPWEVKIITALDDLWLAASQQQSAERPEK